MNGDGQDNVPDSAYDSLTIRLKPHDDHRRSWN
jgi:hypothetical protein